MKYRTKLFFSFSFLATICVFLSLLIVYNESYNLVFNEVRHEGMAIASTLANVLDTKNIQQLRRQEPSKQAYEAVRSQLIAIKRSIAEVFPDIHYLYLVKESRQDPQRFIYAADATENEQVKSNYGDPFLPSDFDEKALHSDSAMAMQKFQAGKRGKWLSATSPVFNQEGLRIGTLYVDIGQSYLTQLRGKLVSQGALVLAMSMVVALFFAGLLANGATRSLMTLSHVIQHVRRGNFSVRCSLQSKGEFSELGEAMNDMILGLQERERLKLGFARYVSSYVLEKIIHSDEPTKLVGERKKVTVLFSDIRQFTALSETLSPEHVVKILNQYFSRMIDVIFAFRGTLDKFIGDAVMAEFGAPLDDPFQEKHALLAALGMRREIDQLNILWSKEGLPKLDIGIGVYTGYAIIGNVGSEKRMEYTAIGEAVDIAQSFESQTKILQKSIIVAQSTYEKVRDAFYFEDLGALSLEDRKDIIHGYHLPFEKNHSILEQFKI